MIILNVYTFFNNNNNNNDPKILQLRSIRRSLTVDSCFAVDRSCDGPIATAMVLSRLDYCNGLSGDTLKDNSRVIMH